jgi:hypothetical protein
MPHSIAQTAGGTVAPNHSRGGTPSIDLLDRLSEMPHAPTPLSAADLEMSNAQLQDRDELYMDTLRTEPGPSTMPSLASRINWAVGVEMGYESDGGVSLGSPLTVVNELLEDVGEMDPYHRQVPINSHIWYTSNAHLPAAVTKTSRCIHSHVSMHCSVPGKINSLVVLNNIYSFPICSHGLRFAECTKCKGKNKELENELNKYLDLLVADHWLLDSGASLHFTFNQNDLCDLQELKTPIPLKTANSTTSITHKGTTLIQQNNQIYKLDPVYFVPDINQRLISLGLLMKDEFNC